MEPIRMLLAKGGLDGHDRGVVLLGGELRKAGFEVIYSGIYQEPEAIARQAVQEDVNIVGVSTHTGAHMQVFGEVMRRLKTSRRSFVVVGGGIIPPDDHEKLRAIGVRAVFSPGDSMSQDIIPALEKLAAQNSRAKAVRDIPALYKAVVRGDDRALARFITLIAQGSIAAHQLLDTADSHSHVVGLSGSGGVGKSSLLAMLVKHAAENSNFRFAILYVDPRSVSGGAFLADRIRLQALHLPEGSARRIFARSISAGTSFKGVSQNTPAIIAAMKAAKKDVVFVESVGVGQEDVGFGGLVDTFVYVVSPDMGDEMQMMKGGAIETADIIVLNKSDRDGADRIYGLLCSFFEKHRSDGWDVRVVKTDALTENGGVRELWHAIEDHREFLAHSKLRGGKEDAAE